MLKLKQLVLSHKAAIILALVASLLTAFPQIYLRIDHKADGIYQGIELLPDSPWSPRVREVMDGHPNFGSIYFKDGKDDPYLLQPLGSQVVGYMGKVFSLDLNNTLLLSRLVLTFAVFLLIYGFVFLFSRDKLAALCGAAVLLLANSILSFFGVTQILRGMSPDNFLHIAQPVNPAMIYLLLFGFFAAFWLFYKEKKWPYGVLSALLLGLNFYNYFYSWTYLYAFGGVLVLLLLVRKQWQEALRMGSVFAGALLLAIPFGLNIYRSSLYPTYLEVGQRFGIVQSHMPLFVGFTVLAALAVFLLWFPRGDKEKYFFGLAILLAPFVTMNQQILTGKVMQAGHYHWYFHKPMAVIFVLLVLFYALSRPGWSVSYKKTLAALVLAVSVATGAFVQVASYYYNGRDGGSVAVERQKYGPVVQWLSDNAQKESVVFANNEASHMVVIYTPQNVAYHRAGYVALVATHERLLDILFAFYRLRGVGATDASEVFFAEQEYLSANLYGLYYRDISGEYEGVPDQKIEEIVAQYRKTLATPAPQWLEQTLRKYEVAYVVWDKKKDPLWQLQKYAFLEEAAVFGDMAVYRVSGK